MPTVAVMGATGTVGAEVVARLAERGYELLALVRRGEQAASPPPSVAELASVRSLPAPGTEAAAADWRAALAGVDVVVDAVGAGGRLREDLLQAALGAGVDVVDLEPEQPAVAAVFDRHPAAATAAGVAIVPGAGLRHAIGDALTAVAADTVELPVEAHIAYLFPGRRAGLSRASPGRRLSAAAALGAPVEVLVHGELTTELPGEARRLAWFPRPVGPSHAAGIAGGEVRSVPRHQPGLRTIRTYLAVPSWRAELLQAGGALARRPALRRRLAARLERERPAPGPATRAAARWGCVAEVAGADRLARAWAYGHDPYTLSAAVAAALVAGLVQRPGLAGVLAPAEVLAPRELLDGVSDVTDLRWSLTATGAR